MTQPVTLPVYRGSELARPAPPAAPGRSATSAVGAVYPETSLWNALRDVLDPELPVSLVDLGLIHAVHRDRDRVTVVMTFTATGCPCMTFMLDDIRTRLLREDGVEEVVVDIVWDPPWSRARMTEQGRSMLRQYGVAV